MRSLFAGSLLAISALALPALAQETMTEDGVIKGNMSIQFNTRTEKDTSGDYVEGSSKLGVQDVYKFDLDVAKTTNFSGEVVRQPNVYTRTLRRLQQGAALGFDIDIAVRNPADLSQRKSVGKWTGLVPIDTATGAFELGGGKKDGRPLRIAIDAVGKAPAFTDEFAGKLIGKAEKKDNLASYTYKRLVGGKEVQVTVKQVDPIKFQNIVLAKGPVGIYPRTTVNGRLDFDYETSNYLTDGITFAYNLDGKEVNDVVTGSIKWVEDANYETNGKGYYDFNLRFNEEKAAKASGEDAAFAGASDEEAFFAVDDNIPSLTGRIEYIDTFSGEDVTASKITYNLKANKLTKQQVMNFFKLWMLAIGPTNDD